MRLTFLGGAGTVTGSKYLVETESKRILVDCGLFQGKKDLRLRNWEPLPIDPASLDAVILTHAHIDHSGYVPLLVRNGFAGPVYCSAATEDLCGILLPDSGYLMERDADYANRRGFSKHHPAKPLYTRGDAEASLARFQAIDFGIEKDLGEGVGLKLAPSGHILGSAFVTLRSGDTTVVFSGDLGRPGSATMVDPACVKEATYLVVESTYGDRLHGDQDPEDALAAIVNRTASRGGTVVVPSFAVGRAQTLLFHFSRLKEQRKIPDLPIFLDSPMAINASDIFCRHLDAHRLSADQCRRMCDAAEYVNRSAESAALDDSHYPMILISASGMATGGRILHHLKRFAPDHQNTILFTGFQAPGTRGDRMVKGEREVKIHGSMVPIRADIEILHMLSAHADRAEILNWLRGFDVAPRRTFVTHGEPRSSQALSSEIAGSLNWDNVVPEYGESVELN